jgi:Tol biopolymer transport system component
MANSTRRSPDRPSPWMVAALAWVAAMACQPSRVEAQGRARRAEPEQIVFWRQRSVGQLETSVLEAVRLKDKKVTKLATRAPALGGNGGFCVALSPDGRQVAYVSGAYWTDNKDGANHQDRKAYLRSLDDPKAAAACLEVEGDHVCWSPDGRQLLVVSYEGDAIQHHLVDVRTKAAKPLKLPEVKAAAEAKGLVGHVVTDWSPDGQWFLTTCSTGAGEEDFKLYRVKRDGSDVRRIERVESGLFGRFSPDGKSVLYVGTREKDREALFVAEVAGGKPRQVSQELNGHLDILGYCWSPDGKRIAYVWNNSPEDRTETQETETFLMVVDADGRNPAAVLSEKSTFGGFTVRGPNWR